VPPRPPIDPERDPFAAGHEDQTPPEVYALRDNGDWRVRVVPNLYPALSPGEPDGDGDPLASGRGEPDLFATTPALGAHEVIVNAPDAVSSLAELEPKQVETAMSVWRERMRAHSDAAYVHIIVNEGKEAGASLPHTHAQLYALPFVPAQVARERERFTAYSDRTQGRNLLEDLLQEEVRRSERIVAIDDEAVALCPFSARVPFHLQIVPRPRASRTTGRSEAGCCTRRCRDSAPPSARCRRSTCGCGPPRATPSASAGASRSCPGSPSSRVSRWARAST
jgi:UDPglucose--hexose-1-phosphate uridylyltransferase